MNAAEMRPLGLGEILDRTFTMYRNHFLLFAAIAAIAHIPVLFVNVIEGAQLGALVGAASGAPTRPPPMPPAFVTQTTWFIVVLLVGYVAAVLTLVVAQGAEVIAASELYMGRSITIRESLRRVRPQVGMLLGALILAGMAVLTGFILLIVPGICLGCRLLVAMPAVVIEDQGPGAALSRSLRLTKGSAGRAFVILLMYLAIGIAVAGVLVFPFEIGMLIAVARHQTALISVWLMLMQAGAVIAQVLAGPVFAIAISIYYYDLRVRKEGFDLQMLMHGPEGGIVPASADEGAGVPSMFGFHG